jgi:3-oxoacyl-[acyl-carrier protein] reductase
MKVMRKKKFGSVVNIASIVGETGNAGQTNYSASKGGAIAMTKSFAIEAASSGIRYNSITPGFIATDMTDELSDEIKNSFTSKIPMNRFGDPKEVADAVAFLLSDHASYITGETLKVNGGMNMA